MSVLAATTQASSPTGPAIKPVVNFFVLSRLDPFTDTLMKLERKHDSLKRRTLTIHESNLRHEFGRWATQDLVNEARSIISEFLKWRSEKDNAEMHLRELHRRASDNSSGNGKHSNGTGNAPDAPSNGNGAKANSNGNGSQAKGSESGDIVELNMATYKSTLTDNGEKEFMEDSVRHTDRRIVPKPTGQLVSEYTEKIHAILDTLERRGEFEARESLLGEHGLKDGLILTMLEERSTWP